MYYSKPFKHSAPPLPEPVTATLLRENTIISMIITGFVQFVDQPPTDAMMFRHTILLPSTSFFCGLCTQQTTSRLYLKVATTSYTFEVVSLFMISISSLQLCFKNRHMQSHTTCLHLLIT